MYRGGGSETFLVCSSGLRRKTHHLYHAVGACGTLGQLNEEGRYGYDKNPQMDATRLYREMQKCDCRDSVEKIREQAAAWLREHP